MHDQVLLTPSLLFLLASLSQLTKLLKTCCVKLLYIGEDLEGSFGITTEVLDRGIDRGTRSREGADRVY